MSTHTSTPRRTLSSLAATGLLLLTTTAPALAGPAPAVNLPDPVGHEGSPVQIYQPSPAADDGLELLQIGLGALGGIALSGLAVAAVRHRPQGSHRHAVA